jgi:Zn-dependent M28 family amino/carboxypeptidase
VLGAVVAAALALAASPGTAAKQTVAEITAFGPRPAGSAAERGVQALVSRRLKAFGYNITSQTFALPRGGSSRNVVARSAGLPRVVVLAHADGVRGTRAANDNASGVALLLELARTLGGRPGVVLAALGAEERIETRSRDHLGSAAFVRSFSGSERRAIRFAVSLDMVGVGTRLRVRGIEARPNRSARLLVPAAPYLRDRLGQSDHAELTRAGIPAAWLQWREDRCWHTSCDTVARVRVANLQAAYDATFAAAEAAL